MTSLSHQRRGARRYGWFDAYRKAMQVRSARKEYSTERAKTSNIAENPNSEKEKWKQD
jgi:hypothetical protein